jgi:predicted transcriptional regulator
MDKITKKRDRLEVIYDLLNIIQTNNNSIKKTPLLRKTNLSSQSFGEYFEELLNKGFIREIEDYKKRRTISLTDKGFQYVNKYKMIIGFVKEFEL